MPRYLSVLSVSLLFAMQLVAAEPETTDQTLIVDALNRYTAQHEPITEDTIWSEQTTSPVSYVDSVQSIGKDKRVISGCSIQPTLLSPGTHFTATVTRRAHTWTVVDYAAMGFCSPMMH